MQLVEVDLGPTISVRNTASAKNKTEEAYRSSKLPASGLCPNGLVSNDGRVEDSVSASRFDGECALLAAS